ncbi:3'(2'),5'-bisphosphate nucleotidase CysQ [Mucilaginibacter sp. L196]|uniref:3'(2'),5'-bisphosphate nucleotidase CysQ n=1 Tax=Mucilaginibacter sp. L196 TaxID=1641870 RepID=UPI00131DB0D4|nr:3'(2'),5'-bisphosphate nucleotidase CysQ [Mucilaginibacter sp. L196]
MIFELRSGDKIDIDKVLDIAKRAGAGILKIYNGASENIQVSFKEDESPLTAADSASHKIISERLAELTPNIPLLSEEGKDIAYDERKGWEYYWCVDPLDGTKEFLKRNGEFTVNIALIYKDAPVLGVIYVPVTGVLYYGAEYIGSWKITNNTEIQPLIVASNVKEWIAVGSRTHSSTEEVDLLAKFDISRTIAVGSSLKFCMIAEGNAHVYYRHGPTMEWDIAAGHAIAVYSGAFMGQPDGEVFKYNKPSLLNGSFLCSIKRDN